MAATFSWRAAFVASLGLLLSLVAVVWAGQATQAWEKDYFYKFPRFVHVDPSVVYVFYAESTNSSTPPVSPKVDTLSPDNGTVLSTVPMTGATSYLIQHVAPYVNNNGTAEFFFVVGKTRVVGRYEFYLYDPSTQQVRWNFPVTIGADDEKSQIPGATFSTDGSRVMTQTKGRIWSFATDNGDVVNETISYSRYVGETNTTETISEPFLSRMAYYNESIFFGLGVDVLNNPLSFCPRPILYQYHYVTLNHIRTWTLSDEECGSQAAMSCCGQFSSTTGEAGPVLLQPSKSLLIANFRNGSRGEQAQLGMVGFDPEDISTGVQLTITPNNERGYAVAETGENKLYTQTISGYRTFEFAENYLDSSILWTIPTFSGSQRHAEYTSIDGIGLVFYCTSEVYAAVAADNGFVSTRADFNSEDFVVDCSFNTQNRLMVGVSSFGTGGVHNAMAFHMVLGTAPPSASPSMSPSFQPSYVPSSTPSTAPSESPTPPPSGGGSVTYAADQAVPALSAFLFAMLAFVL